MGIQQKSFAVIVSDLNGALAMPLSREIHDLLYRNARNSSTRSFGIAMWLGMSDIQVEGQWIFVNGTPVASSPNFSSTFISFCSLTLHRLFVKTANKNLVELCFQQSFSNYT